MKPKFSSKSISTFYLCSMALICVNNVSDFLYFFYKNRLYIILHFDFCHDVSRFQLFNIDFVIKFAFPSGQLVVVFLLMCFVSASVSKAIVKAATSKVFHFLASIFFLFSSLLGSNASWSLAGMSGLPHSFNASANLLNVAQALNQRQHYWKFSFFPSNISNLALLSLGLPSMAKSLLHQEYWFFTSMVQSFLHQGFCLFTTPRLLAL